jgi:hypothetical protein
MGVAPDVRGGGAIPASVPTEGMTEAQLFEQIWKQTA